ncbi:MAG: dimethyladenosine transferase [Clostridiales bacterium]|jgi:16S rRNA (adenine1518-N6/adenine1519-N6)-dimethyltransferase|nr:dimethyladenosine transferase [Clostridiales bacterium]
MESIYSPRAVRDLLKKNGLHAKKSLGQNFLTDRNIVQKIAEAAEVDYDTVVEIGPGIGALTLALAARAEQVIALELDKKIVPVLREVTSGFANITIVEGDAVKENFDTLVEGVAGPQKAREGYRVAANLPYYVTTPIIMHLFEKDFNIKSMVFMMQKEVADRIMAEPGGKDYGSLSVVVQFFAKPSLVTKVPPTVFLPQPEVESAVIRLDKHKSPPVNISNKEFFFKVVRAAFGKRRKTLLNALSNSALKLDKTLIQKACEKSGIDPKTRAETLSIEQFADLSENLSAW